MIDEDRRWPPCNQEVIEGRPSYLGNTIYLSILLTVEKLKDSIPLTEEERCYIFDRYFTGMHPIKGTKPFPNQKLVFYLSYLARHYEWDECYEINKKLERKSGILINRHMNRMKIRDRDIKREYEDIYYFYTRYEVREEHSD